MNRVSQLIAGWLIAAFGGAAICAADESAGQRYSAPVRVLPESKPESPAANMMPTPTMSPMPAALVPPQYRTERRSQAPIGSSREDAASSIVRFVVPLVERPVLVEARITIDGKPYRALREERIDGVLAELARPDRTRAAAVRRIFLFNMVISLIVRTGAIPSMGRNLGGPG